MTTRPSYMARNRECVRLAKKGMTAAQIAKATGLHSLTVRRHLKHANIKPQRPQSSGPLADLRAVQREVRKYGVTGAADSFGVSRQAIYNALKRAG
jgi:DNA-binding phage protein